MFTEVNPDKGTETSSKNIIAIMMADPFTEVNPDKGTETVDDRAILELLTVYRS